MPSARTRLPSAAYQTLGAFRQALTRYARLSEEHIRRAGLTPQQYELLVVLGGAGDEPPSVGQAAAALAITHNSAVGLTQRAERAGLLVRVPGPSRRRGTRLHLTEAGARTLDAVTGDLIRTLGGERSEMLETLARWRDLLGAGRLDHPAAEPGGPEYHLAAAGFGERPLVWRLLQLHLYEQSPYHRGDTDERGEYLYETFDAYWGAGGASYLVRVSGRPAGFALVRRRDDVGEGRPGYEVAEFCILHKHRGHHLGLRVAADLLHARPGRWSVAFHEHNLSARAFWQDVARRHGVRVAREQRPDAPGTQARLTFEVASA